MRHLSKIMFLLTVLAGAVLAGCSDNDTVTFRVVATTDVHGNIFDTDCLTGEQREGSLAKVATFLKGERKANRNVIYLDAGDILQGSVDVYQDITAQYGRTSLPAEAYNLLGCCASVMGNHDFAVGAMSYDRFFRSITFPMLGANVYYNKPGDYLPPYRIRDVQGLNVAVLGLTTPIVNYSIPSDQMEVDIADILESAKYWMPVLREQEHADVVIGLLHSGFEGGRMDDEGLYENVVGKLLSEVPGFDLVIFGHDHKEFCRKMTDCNGDSVLLMNPGPFARKVAVATVSVSRNGATVKTEGHLEDMTGLEPDSRFIKKLTGWYGDVKHYSDSVIGSVSAPLEARGVLWRNSSIMDYVHTVQMAFNGADISLTSLVLTTPYVPAGDVRVKDMFALYHFDNTMVSVMMSGSEIKDLLEYSAGLFYNTVKSGEGGLLKMKPDGEGGNLPLYSIKNLITAAGIDYEIDVTKPEGERISILSMSDGKRFNPDKMYRTTINSFLYGGGESALFKATGLKPKDMSGRLNGSSSADIRFYLLTDLALKQEDNVPVKVRKVTNWKLVPVKVASDCLAKDTVGFNIMHTQTSNLWD